MVHRTLQSYLQSMGLFSGSVQKEHRKDYEQRGERHTNSHTISCSRKNRAAHNTEKRQQYPGNLPVVTLENLFHNFMLNG